MIIRWSAVGLDEFRSEWQGKSLSLRREPLNFVHRSTGKVAYTEPVWRLYVRADAGDAERRTSDRWVTAKLAQDALETWAQKQITALARSAAAPVARQRRDVVTSSAERAFAGRAAQSA